MELRERLDDFGTPDGALAVGGLETFGMSGRLFGAEGERIVRMLAGALGQNGELCVGTGAAVGEFVQEATAGLRGDRNAFGEGVVRKEARGTLALWPAGRTGRAPVNRTRHVRRQNCVEKGGSSRSLPFLPADACSGEDPEPTVLLQFEEKAARIPAVVGGAERSTKKGAAVKPPLRAVPFSRRWTGRGLVRQSGGLFAGLDFLAEGLFN